jgi:hypothetical protein
MPKWNLVPSFCPSLKPTSTPYASCGTPRPGPLRRAARPPSRAALVAPPGAGSSRHVPALLQQRLLRVPVAVGGDPGGREVGCIFRHESHAHKRRTKARITVHMLAAKSSVGCRALARSYKG